MKKLLVLLLVLGLVSVASATPKVLYIATGVTEGVAPAGSDYADAGDELSIAPSDLLWIGVYNTAAGTEGDTGQDVMWLSISDNGGGEWTSNYQIYAPPGFAGFANEYMGKEAAPGLDLWQLNITDGVPDHFVGVGVVDAKEFHCLTQGVDVTATLWGSGEVVVDSFIIHQIPEPMTIGLLGLGGLFLRRRK